MSDVKNPWQRLGFRDTPYRREPLSLSADDSRLHVGREAEAAKFDALVESTDGTVLIVSGDAGLGKTSFLNVQQYRIRSGEASISKLIIPCHHMTTADAGTTPAQLARRIAHNLIGSLEIEAEVAGTPLPERVRRIRAWLSHEGAEAGKALAFQFAGAGVHVERTFAVSSVADATIENWKDIIEVLADSTRQFPQMDGAFVCIDNAETLSVPELTAILMSYRDTLFQIPRLWWVVIGQKNLYAQIELANKRVSQRIRGSGIEIPPLSSEELHLLIERRVQALREKSDAKSPFSANIHGLLMEAACGQPRYVLASSDDLFTELVQRLLEVVDRASRQSITGIPAREHRNAMLDSALQKLLVDKQIDDQVAEGFLRQSVERRLREKRLSAQSLKVLRAIADSEHYAVPPDEIDLYKTDPQGVLSALDLLTRSDLLFETEFGGRPHHQLKGDGWLCHYFDLWKEIAPPARPKKKPMPRPGKAKRPSVRPT